MSKDTHLIEYLVIITYYILMASETESCLRLLNLGLTIAQQYSLGGLRTSCLNTIWWF
jgi:hypothetical protein